MFRRLLCGSLCLVFILFLGCATTDAYRPIDDEVYLEKYDDGVSLIDKNQKSMYRERDALLFYLDKGLLTHYARRFDESIPLLQEGERAIEAAYTKSVIQEIGTYILSDNTREYGGEDYEDVYINVFNALNYYHQNNLEDALVEIRRMTNKLQFLAAKYGVLMTDMQKMALEHSATVPANEHLASATFSDSALARYLGILFYRGIGRYDDVRIDRDHLKAAFANAPAVYSYPVPASVDAELDIPQGKARLNVLAFSGMAPIKEEEVIRIPLPNVRWIKIALPVLVDRPSQVSRIEAVIDNGTRRFDLELLEDMGAVARETFKEKEGLIYMKSILRATIKGVSSSVLDAASDQTEGGTSLLLSILSVGAQVMAEATERADLRISRYFPGKAHVGGIDLDPGLYSVTVNYYAGNGRLITSYSRNAVEVRADAVNLIEAVCLR
ncbi:MAG: hypothetical protein LBE17_11355 [Treponema sp.]|jgi:hypothetical protein|nr:hypothetical protein [Treponema sp.]